MNSSSTLEQSHPCQNLRGLGIRQPWVELILRGWKTVEVRSLPTRVRGTVYLYSATAVAHGPAVDSAVDRTGLDTDSLARGSIVGTVEIVDCRPADPDDAVAAWVAPEVLTGQYVWTLANPIRFPVPLVPTSRTYGVWFYPFRLLPPGLPARRRRPSPASKSVVCD